MFESHHANSESKALDPKNKVQNRVGEEVWKKESLNTVNQQLLFLLGNDSKEKSIAPGPSFDTKWFWFKIIGLLNMKLSSSSSLQSEEIERESLKNCLQNQLARLVNF